MTAVLKDLLNNGLIDHDVTSSVGNVTVTALPPDRIDTSSTSAQSQLNLFLYQVTANQGWRNADLPSRNKNGDRVSNPPLALNLHYLLTAYGAEELHSEILLGYGMQLLHETPVLARNAIRTSLAAPSSVSGGGGLPSSMQALYTSELAEQVEQIKITPQALSTEEIAKLWTAFQAKYRPTAAYMASVVLIESTSSTKQALPVTSRNINISQLRRPSITDIKSQATAADELSSDQAILAGYRIAVIGAQLAGDETRVNVGGIEVTPEAADLTDGQIVVAIPEDLSAGTQSIQVVQYVSVDSSGDASSLRPSAQSNTLMFVLRPAIEAVSASNVVDEGGGLRSADIELTISPAVAFDQKVVLLLDDLSTGGAYSFIAPSRLDLESPPSSDPEPADTITIPVSELPAGTYVVRVRVDDAESPLTQDSGTGQFNSPQVAIA